MNLDRAQQYITQALGLLARFEPRVQVPSDMVGEWVSLRRNLESALADLEQPTAPPSPAPGA